MSKGDWNEVKSPWVTWAKIGDYIEGTWISVREMPDMNKEGYKKKVYEIKADGGEFHVLDAEKQIVPEPVKIAAGEIYNVGGTSYLPEKGATSPFDGSFRNLKLGQKVKIEFVKSIPPIKAGYSPTKVRKVFVNGQMDEEWLAEQAGEQENKVDFGGM